MPDFPESQLPKDPQYWADLSRRIRQDAGQVLAAYAARHDSWYQVLSRRAVWLVSSSAAAMLLLWLSLPIRVQPGDLGWMEPSLMPSESAGALLSGPVPPGIDDLVAAFFSPAFEDDGGGQ